MARPELNNITELVGLLPLKVAMMECMCVCVKAAVAAL